LSTAFHTSDKYLWYGSSYIARGEEGATTFMTAYWTSLSHNGVAIPDQYEPEGLSVKVRGREVKLSPLAEEMAYHLAKKKDTQYIQDPVFRSNFMQDFTAQLPDWCRGASYEEVDFSQLFDKVDREKREKESLSKEERKKRAADRKARREALKERYGYAVLDGERVEIANWMVEPPGLFMGRGQHPLRGHWKPRVTQRDIILNLDEKAPVPPGDWKQVVHDHESTWIAKWVDKLTGKEKYVWLHDSAPIQQSRNRAKYDNAMRVRAHLPRIRARIEREMNSKDEKMRQVATVCYLIDRLGMRVGDEKDEDEADTAGATTLRVEHVSVGQDSVSFSFLGKDSVPWNKKLESPPPVLLRNLKEFVSGKRQDQLVFDDIDSTSVNRFLSSILPGLTAKVFRTHHATLVAEQYLRSTDVREKDEVEKLYHAKMANLEAAIFCNHQRTVPKNWESSLEKKKQKLEELRSREKRDEKRLKKLMLDIDLQLKTKTYNLNTALKNYIDPRVYKSWCDYVGLDWSRIYTKSMQRKFSWAARSHQRWEKDRLEVLARTSGRSDATARPRAQT
jgi:DNA topoisomerase-1